MKGHSRQCRAARTPAPQFDQFDESFERDAGVDPHRRIADEILRAQPRHVAAIDLVDAQRVPVVAYVGREQRTVERDGQDLLRGIVVGRSGVALVRRAFPAVAPLPIERLSREKGPRRADEAQRVCVSHAIQIGDESQRVINIEFSPPCDRVRATEACRKTRLVVEQKL